MNNKIKTIRSRMTRLYTDIVLFVYMYQPNLKSFIGIDNYLLMLTVSVPLVAFVILTDIRKKRISKRTMLAILFIIASAAYILMRGLIAGEEQIKIFTNVFKILILILYALIAYSILIRKKNNKEKIIESIIRVGLFQVLIAVMMLIVPSLKNISMSIFYGGGRAENIYISASRLYGICDGDYTYGLQILHALLASISFAYAFHSGKKKYYLYAALLILVTFLNGRSGLIIFAANIILLIVYRGIINKGVMWVMKAALVALVASAAVLSLVKNVAPAAYHNIEVMAADIEMSESGRGNTETEAYKRMYVVPEGLGIIFGNGYRIYARNGGRFGVEKSSDIGFVNDLFLGGIIYCLLLLLAILTLRHEMSKDEMSNAIWGILIVTFIMGNLKGEFIRQPLLICTSMLFAVYLMIRKKELYEETHICNSASL